MNSLKELHNKYIDEVADFDYKISEIERKQELLENKIKRLENKRPTWIKGMIIPLAKEMMSRTNTQYFRICGPFGIECETSIYLSNERKGKDTRWFIEESNIDICNVETYSLTLRPDKNNYMQYFTGEYINRYPQGSLGELNGGNMVFEPLPDNFDDIAKLMQHNVKESK